MLQSIMPTKYELRSPWDESHVRFDPNTDVVAWNPNSGEILRRDRVLAMDSSIRPDLVPRPKYFDKNNVLYCNCRLHNGILLIADVWYPMGRINDICTSTNSSGSSRNGKGATVEWSWFYAKQAFLADAVKKIDGLLNDYEGQREYPEEIWLMEHQEFQSSGFLTKDFAGWVTGGLNDLKWANEKVDDHIRDVGELALDYEHAEYLSVDV